VAPAITHFLVGAALLLFVAALLTVRYGVDRRNAFWIIPLGGIWGLLPDIHHIAPVLASELYAFHNMPWADLFAFHYTLDREFVRDRYYHSVIGSIVLFCLASGVSGGQNVWKHDLRRPTLGSSGLHSPFSRQQLRRVAPPLHSSQ